MKTLFPKQQESVDRLLQALKQHGCALDSSMTGVGKTIIASRVALQSGRPVLVLCPKIVIPHWERELAEVAVKPLGVLNYEKLRRGNTPWLNKIGKKLYRWCLPEGTLLVFDECHYCLPKGTKVLRPDGNQTPIESLQEGDLVATPVGARRVSQAFITGDRDICIVHHKNGMLRSSHDHRILTTVGWVQAKEITERHTLLLQNMRDPSVEQQINGMPPVLLQAQAEESCEEMPHLRGGVHPHSVPFQRGFVLLTEMFGSSPATHHDSRETRGHEPKNVPDGETTSGLPQAMGIHEGRWEPNTLSFCSGENIAGASGNPEAPPERRERDWANRPSDDSAGRATQRLGIGAYCVGWWERVRCGLSRMAHYGGRSCAPREEVGSGSGRTIPQHPKGESEGREKRSAVGRSWVARLSSDQPRGHAECGRVYLQHSPVLRVEILDQKEPCYDIEVEDVHCFVAEGVVVHNCKGAFTQNTQMLIAAKQQGFGVLMLSATACKDPTEMRGIGYVLGLHALNKPVDGLQSWFGWMIKLGCKKDPWNNWKAGPRDRLAEVRDCIYPHKGVQLTPNDLPRAFAENHVMTEPLAFSALKDIASFYEQHGITPEIVDRFLEGGVDAPNVLVEMLRARQLAEAAKVPDILDMVRDARDEGYSVVVFVNFTETLNTLCAMLGPDTARVCGGQNGSVREQNVQRFQRNECGVIVCNTAAGGVGVSLHDEHGGHPRMSLISPTFNEKEYVQVLGRIHRAGSQSPALQRVLVASKTIEEKVIAKLEEKRKDMAALHEQPKTES